MTVWCVKCREPKTVSCTDDEYVAWKNSGALIQNAMPNVPKEERELLISGYCGDCWEKLFRAADVDG